MKLAHNRSVRFGVLLIFSALLAFQAASGTARAAMSDAEFLKLCADGEAQDIYVAIGGGANVNAVNNLGQTALMEAVIYNDLEAAAVLIGGGANPKAWNGILATADYAYGNSDPKVLKLILDCINNPDYANAQIAKIERKMERGIKTASKRKHIEGMLNVSSGSSYKFTAMEQQAQQGSPMSQYMLADMYEKGSDTAQNLPEAVKWYEKAAAQGYVMAENRLGEMYLSGTGVRKDEAKAEEWFKKAASKGHTGAKASLDSMKTITVAVESGSGSASATRAASSSTGTDSFARGKSFYDARNYAKAAEQFRKAAQSNDTDAMYYLGVMHEAGDGVKQDNKQAADWFRKAADAGHADAGFSIASMFEDGRGVTKSPAKAVEYLKLAASGGNGMASKRLIDLGETPPPNTASAAPVITASASDARQSSGSSVTSVSSTASVSSVAPHAESDPVADAIMKSLAKYMDSALTEAGIDLPSGGATALFSEYGGEEVFTSYLNSTLAEAGINLTGGTSGIASLLSGDNQQIGEQIFATYLDAVLAEGGMYLPGGFSALMSSEGGEEMFMQSLGYRLSQAGVDIPGLGGLLGAMTGDESAMEEAAAGAVMDMALGGLFGF